VIRKLLALAGIMTTGQPARWGELREAAKHDPSPRKTVVEWMLGSRSPKAAGLFELVEGPKPEERDGSRLAALPPSFFPWRHQLGGGRRVAPRTGNGLRDAILSRPDDPRCRSLRAQVAAERLEQTIRDANGGYLPTANQDS
jgi:hypothetical protein